MNAPAIFAKFLHRNKQVSVDALVDRGIQKALHTVFPEPGEEHRSGTGGTEKAVYAKIWLGAIAAHNALTVYSGPEQEPMSPYREALRKLYMAIHNVYAEHPKITMQHEVVEFLQALLEAFHGSDIDHQQALTAAVQVISSKVIAQDPGVAVALAQANNVLRPHSKAA